MTGQKKRPERGAIHSSRGRELYRRVVVLRRRFRLTFRAGRRAPWQLGRFGPDTEATSVSHLQQQTAVGASRDVCG